MYRCEDIKYQQRTYSLYKRAIWMCMKKRGREVTSKKGRCYEASSSFDKKYKNISLCEKVILREALYEPTRSHELRLFTTGL